MFFYPSLAYFTMFSLFCQSLASSCVLVVENNFNWVAIEPKCPIDPNFYKGCSNSRCLVGCRVSKKDIPRLSIS